MSTLNYPTGHTVAPKATFSIPSILAIVFGARALKRSNELRASGQEDRTRGLAVAGIVLGIVGGVWGLIQGLIILVGFLPIFLIDVS